MQCYFQFARGKTTILLQRSAQRTHFRRTKCILRCPILQCHIHHRIFHLSCTRIQQCNEVHYFHHQCPCNVIKYFSSMEIDHAQRTMCFMFHNTPFEYVIDCALWEKIV